MAMVLGLLQYLLPFAVLMLTPAIASIDPDLERAAKNCGANQWETFRHVVLPLARPRHHRRDHRHVHALDGELFNP